MPTPTTTPQTPPLTAPQARALLRAVLSTTPRPTTPHHPTTTPPPTSKSLLQRPHQQPVPTHQTITIDVSTRIMGHCNNIQLPSPSSVDQTTRIEQLVRGVLTDVARRTGPIQLTVQSGISVVGSRNVVVLGEGGAEKGVSVESNPSCVKDAGLGVGRKRKAEEPVDVDVDEMVEKKLKFERDL